MNTAFTRRQWLARAAAAAGACGLGRLTILAGEAPSKKLRCAVIGCGGRGRSHTNEAAKEQLVALCDVDDRNLAAT
ncbi:MAG: gfo/Idh/MocA family oxidoreductase, partial [Planctomycetes bacterium]|nr:gfo/Idh/MocA family oxidoreductase [Planctomycetota bacterium]